MVKKLLALALLFIAVPSMATFSGYTYRRTLTIPAVKVSTESSTYSNVTILDSGNPVDQSHLVTGFDLIYSTDPNCGSILPFQGDQAYSLNQAAWVLVPVLSSVSDTVYYKFYGNAAITSDQSSSATWTSDFKQVLHVSSTTTAFPQNVSLKDATSNANNAAFAGVQPNLHDGQVYGSIRITGAGTGGWTFIDAGPPTVVNGSSFTVTYWSNPEQNGTIAGQEASTWGRYVSFGLQQAGAYSPTLQNHVVLLKVPGTMNAWQMVTWIYDGAQTIFCVNATCASTTTGAPYGGTTTDDFIFGDPVDTPAQSYDEMEMSTNAYTPGWVFNRYTNLTDSGFLVQGPETQSTPPPTPQNDGLTIQGGKVTIQGGMVTIQ